MSKISFVIPCYRSEATIERVINEVESTVSQRPEYEYEIICVNDFSPDDVGKVLAQIANKNDKVKVIEFAKNAGKHAAVLAGHRCAGGDYIVDMDDDYQCPAYELWKLIEPLEMDECDIATAKYYEKKEARYKKIGSTVNAWMTYIMLEKPKGLRFENFLAMKRFVSDEMIKYNNPYTYLEGLMCRVTTRVKMVPMEERERGDNNASGFTLKKSISLWCNGLTAFSVKPLRVASIIGCVFAVLGFLWGIIIIIRKFMNPGIPLGYSSLAAILLCSSGLIMMMLGIIGEYIGRIYICINMSPQYVIKNTINVKSE